MVNATGCGPVILGSIPSVHPKNVVVAKLEKAIQKRVDVSHIDGFECIFCMVADAPIAALGKVGNKQQGKRVSKEYTALE